MRQRLFALCLAALALCPALAACQKQDVSSASPEQRAEMQQLASRYAEKLEVPITLSDGSRSLVRTRKELGIRLDLDRMAAGGENPSLAFVIDPEATRATLETLIEDFGIAPEDARLYSDRGQLRIVEGKPGTGLDIDATADRLAEAVQSNPATQKIVVVLTERQPEVTADKLQEISGVLSQYQTRVSGTAKRLKNVRLATNLIDGALLDPGETFSLNETVGPRTGKRGFRTAPVFIDAEKVPGVGGGVSQVTGTLFNAAALAGLKIDEVHPHSRPVSYIPVGRDATVAFGSKDLKFTNNTDGPVYIRYELKGRTLRATFFGQKPDGRVVALEPQVDRRGPGNIHAELYRTIKGAGPVQREQLYSHTYRWDPST